MKKIIWLGLLFCLNGRGLGQEKVWEITSATVLSLGHRVLVDRWVFGKEVPLFFKKDGAYLGGAVLAQVSLPMAILDWQDKPKHRKWGKEAYFVAVTLASAVGGMNDAIIWRKKYPAGGIAYYTVNALAAINPNAAMCYWQPAKKDGLLVTASALLAGSVAWDWVFCNNEPIPNWFGGWGLKTKKERNFFDLSRLVFSGVLYVLATNDIKKATDFPVACKVSLEKIYVEVKF